MANDKQQSGMMFNALTAGSKIVGNITADSVWETLQQIAIFVSMV